MLRGFGLALDVMSPDRAWRMRCSAFQAALPTFTVTPGANFPAQDTGRITSEYTPHGYLHE